MEEVPDATDVQAIPRSGLTGLVQGTPVRLGRPGYLDPAALAPEVQRLQEAGATAVLVEIDERVVAAIGVATDQRLRTDVS